MFGSSRRELALIASSSRCAQGEEAFYPGCIDRVYSRQREAALFELYNNVEKLQAAPTVLRRFQQGTRLALHIDERNLMAQNITDIHELPTTDIIALFDLPVESDVEEGWCTRILDIYGSLFFRRVVDTKFASKVWLDIEGDLPVSAKMAERIYQSPSSVAWPEGDANMDRFYAARKKTLVRAGRSSPRRPPFVCPVVRPAASPPATSAATSLHHRSLLSAPQDMLVKDREVRSEANAQAMHGKELMWEEMSAEFRGVMGDGASRSKRSPVVHLSFALLKSCLALRLCDPAEFLPFSLCLAPASEAQRNVRCHLLQTSRSRWWLRGPGRRRRKRRRRCVPARSPWLGGRRAGAVPLWTVWWCGGGRGVTLALVSRVNQPPLRRVRTRSEPNLKLGRLIGWPARRRRGVCLQPTVCCARRWIMRGVCLEHLQSHRPSPVSLRP